MLYSIVVFDRLLVQPDPVNLTGSRLTQKRSLEACGSQPVGHDLFEDQGPFIGVTHQISHISDVCKMIPNSSKITV